GAVAFLLDRHAPPVGLHPGLEDHAAVRGAVVSERAVFQVLAAALDQAHQPIPGSCRDLATALSDLANSHGVFALPPPNMPVDWVSRQMTSFWAPSGRGSRAGSGSWFLRLSRPISSGSSARAGGSGRAASRTPPCWCRTGPASDWP